METTLVYIGGVPSRGRGVSGCVFCTLHGHFRTLRIRHPFPLSFPQPRVWFQFLGSAEQRGGSCATLLDLTPSIFHGQVSSAAPQHFHLRLLFDLTCYNEGKWPKDALERLGREAALPAAAAWGGEARPLPEVCVCASPSGTQSVFRSGLWPCEIKNPSNFILFPVVSFLAYLPPHNFSSRETLCFCIEVNTKNDTDSLYKIILDLKVMKTLKIPFF